MATRYRFLFTDTSGDQYEGVIRNINYSGPETIVNGSASLQYDLSDNVFQPIQAKTCNISLLATTLEDLSDIYNEVDRYWNFRLSINGVQEFTGYISTEDMEQSFSSSKWVLNFDAYSPLTYLENFGYYDSSGLPFSGDESLINIIVNCLNKGFNENSERLGIRAYHYLDVNGNDLFQNTYLDQGQFYDEDGEAEDCKQVLSDILKSLGCFIFQWDFTWYILPVTTWRDLIITPITFISYGPTGIVTGSHTLNTNGGAQRIGDKPNGAPIHHINENQSFYIKRFYNNFRIRHDFDYALQILPNGELVGSGATMPNWTLQTDATVVGDTIEIDGKELVSEEVLAATSSTVSLKENDVLEVDILAEYVDDPTEQTFKIILEGDSGTDYTYRLLQPLEDSENVEGEWLALPVGGSVHDSIEFKPIEGEMTHLVELQALPEDGDLYVEVYTGIFGSAHTASSKTILKHFKIKAKEQPIEAEQFTYSRTDVNTGEVPEPYEIRFNTSDRNILRNIFKDSLGVALANFQKDAANVTMVDELGRMFLGIYSENQKVFSGGVFGNVEALTPKRIDSVGSPFIITSFNKDLQQNTSSLTLWEVFFDVPSFTKETERVFKNPIKPNIKS